MKYSEIMIKTTTKTFKPGFSCHGWQTSSNFYNPIMFKNHNILLKFGSAKRKIVTYVKTLGEVYAHLVEKLGGKYYVLWIYPSRIWWTRSTISHHQLKQNILTDLICLISNKRMFYQISDRKIQTRPETSSVIKQMTELTKSSFKHQNFVLLPYKITTMRHDVLSPWT